MKRATLVLGFAGMALAFTGGLIVLPVAVFLLAAISGPLFVAGTLVGIAWLARPKRRLPQVAIAAGPLPVVQALMPASNNIRPWR